jgi:hypothetical protein
MVLLDDVVQPGYKLRAPFAKNPQETQHVRFFYHKLVQF